MPRALSAAMLALLSTNAVSPALFVAIAFANETLYLWGGVSIITPPGPATNPLSTFPYGQAFTGVGWLGRISAVPQSKQVIAQNITLALSGIPPQLLSDTLSQVRLNGSATVWLGFFDSSNNLIGDPLQIFSGNLDVPSVSDGAVDCTVAITCENPLIGLNFPPNRYFDDADQQTVYPGDLGFSFVQNLANQQLFWPAPSTSGSPYPLFLTVTPATVDIAIGGTAGITITMHYSDGSTYSIPSHAGGGPAFASGVAMSNPAIATFDYNTGLVTGVAAGECSIMVRAAYPVASINDTQFRAAAALIVHS